MYWVEDILKEPFYRQALRQIGLEEGRLRMHCVQIPDTLGPTTAERNFFDFILSVQSEQKAKILRKFFTRPVATLPVTSRVTDEWRRIFDGEDFSQTFSFSDPQCEEDWTRYRSERFGRLREELFDEMVQHINSVVVVDPCGMGTATYSFIRHYDLIGWQTHPDGQTLAKVVWKYGEDAVVALDEWEYNVCILDDRDKSKVKEVYHTYSHNLPYCPAAWFWSEKYSTENVHMRLSPFASHLSDLDWLLYYKLCKRHLDSYGSYPIYATYQRPCGYSDQSTGNYCDGGLLRNPSNEYVYGPDGKERRCPACSGQAFVGPGTYVKAPIPYGPDDPRLSEAVDVTSADSNALSFNTEEVKRLEDDLYESLVGKLGKAQDLSAVNEKQVTASTEDRTQRLMKLKRPFERIQAFIEDTCCTIRYGDRFLGSSLNYGTSFFEVTGEELIGKIKSARSAGASQSLILSLADDLIVKEFKTDHKSTDRMRLLNDLEPYSHLSLSEAYGLVERGVMSNEEYGIKASFPSLLGDFEDTEGPVELWKTHLPIARRKRMLRDKIKSKYGDTKPKPDAGSNGGAQDAVVDR